MASRSVVAETPLSDQGATKQEQTEMKPIMGVVIAESMCECVG